MKAVFYDEHGNELGRTDTDLEDHFHYAFFCRTCGKVWGRIALYTADVDSAPFEWFVTMHACEKHKERAWDRKGEWQGGGIMHLNWWSDKKNMLSFYPTHVLKQIFLAECYDLEELK